MTGFAIWTRSNCRPHHLDLFEWIQLTTPFLQTVWMSSKYKHWRPNNLNTLKIANAFSPKNWTRSMSFRGRSSQFECIQIVDIIALSPKQFERAQIVDRIAPNNLNAFKYLTSDPKQFERVQIVWGKGFAIRAHSSVRLHRLKQFERVQITPPFLLNILNEFKWCTYCPKQFERI